MAGRISRVFLRQKADTLRKHGLYQKARELYQKMLAASEQMPPAVKSGVERQLKQIELEISTGSDSKGSEQTKIPVAGIGGKSPDMRSLIEHIINGSVAVETSEAFRCILDEYPEEPDLLRIYAGRLASDNRTQAAAKAYAKSAALFFDADRIFQGWICKVLEWRLQRAPREQMTEVQKAIRGANPQNPIDEFVKQLTWSERTAVTSRFETSVFAGRVGCHLSRKLPGRTSIS